ncbi:hypothetical protein ABZP36_001298 [Zizania latifolia]
MVCDSKLPVQRKVCVVGAGMAGLAAAAHELHREGHAVTVLEQADDVGGQWLYDPRTDDDDPLGAAPAPARVHSSMYASLRLISPREAMGFSDFPFVPRDGRDPRCFPGHREFGLMDAVRLNTRVLRVAMAPCQASAGGEPKWVVRSLHLGERDDADEKASVEEVFDAVVVATGHYSQPILPSIKGGGDGGLRRAGDNGKDIALDLIGVAREVHLSAKSTEEAMTPAMSKMLAMNANLRLHPQIDRLHDDGRVVFDDTVMYGTGYAYSFPFVDAGGGEVTVDDNRVGPLFEHVFPPALSFIGILRKARWIAQVLSGRRALPPEEEMARSVEEYYRAREAAGVPVKYTHDIGGVETLARTEHRALVRSFTVTYDCR